MAGSVVDVDKFGQNIKFSHNNFASKVGIFGAMNYRIDKLYLIYLNHAQYWKN